MISWCMLLNAAFHTANTLIVVKLKVFSDMGYNARRVLQEVAFCARKCGISCNFMREHARSQNVMCHVASEWIDVFSPFPAILHNASILLAVITLNCPVQGFEGTFEKVAAAI